jgi:hypothetical protein
MPRAKRTAESVVKYSCDCGAELLTDSDASVRQHEKSIKHLTWAKDAVKVGQFDGDDDPRRQPYDRREPEEDYEPPKVAALGGKQAQELMDEAGQIVAEWHEEALDFLAGTPVAEAYVEQERDQNIRNWLILCRTHPKLLEATVKSANYKAYTQLGRFLVGMGVAGGVEMGWLAGDGGPARLTGVIRAFETVQEQFEEIEEEVGDRYRTTLSEYDAEHPPGLFGELATGT